jgi:hypothetical protein
MPGSNLVQVQSAKGTVWSLLLATSRIERRGSLNRFVGIASSLLSCNTTQVWPDRNVLIRILGSVHWMDKESGYRSGSCSLQDANKNKFFFLSYFAFYRTTIVDTFTSFFKDNKSLKSQNSINQFYLLFM